MIRQRDVTPECWQKLQEAAGLAAPKAPPALDDESEKDFQARFVNLFRDHGWKGYHPYDSRKSQAGYPDWTLVRERVIWVELKSESGRLDAAQEIWRDRLLEAKQEWHLFRPSDWPEIQRTLKRGGKVGT